MRTFCKANAPAEYASRPLAALEKPSASAFAHDEFSVVSIQFSVRRKKRQWSKLKERDREITDQSEVHIYFSCSYLTLRTEMARHQYPGAWKRGRNLFLLLLKTDN